MHTKRLRFHHLCCMPLFSGKGYSDEFTENMWSVKTNLEKENSLVELTSGCDSICEKCPNRQNGNYCIKNGRINEDVILKDREISAFLGMGENYTDEFFTIMQTAYDKFTAETFGKFCGRCKWGEMGLCGYYKWKEAAEKIIAQK